MNTKDIAIDMCKRFGVDPFLRTKGIRQKTIEVMGEDSYEMWEYWEKMYVVPIIEMHTE